MAWTTMEPDVDFELTSLPQHARVACTVSFGHVFVGFVLRCSQPHTESTCILKKIGEQQIGGWCHSDQSLANVELRILQLHRCFVADVISFGMQGQAFWLAFFKPLSFGVCKNMEQVSDHVKVLKRNAVVNDKSTQEEFDVNAQLVWVGHL